MIYRAVFNLIVTNTTWVEYNMLFVSVAFTFSNMPKL